MPTSGSDPSTVAGAHGRFFFALWPVDSLAGALHGVACDVAQRFGGRPMKRETLHLTLAFLGEVPLDRLPSLIAAAERVQEAMTPGSWPVMTLNRLGVWRHNHIVWAGCSQVDRNLATLAAALKEQLGAAGFALEDRPFAPHLTLVRKVGEVANIEELPLLPTQQWRSEEFVLVRSRLSDKGSAYETVARWRLN